ncbi:MAG: phosphatase PAP2 family protein [Salinivirgaceae bacterium]|nr:phosphatase PAP2 family protein [Salinivirgaceae bacterium]
MNRSLVTILLIGQFLFSFSQSTEFPYDLKKRNIILPAIGVTSELLFRNNEELSKNDIASFNNSTINSFDRSATSFFNPKLDKISNGLTVALVLSPIAINFYGNKKIEKSHLFIYSVMYTEAILVSFSISDFSKRISKRSRPYLYNDDISNLEKWDEYEKDKSYSFFSKQSALAFCSATFLSKTFTDIYGKSKSSQLVWIGTHTLAASVALLRVYSGQHYPTDVIAGAFVGSFIGYIVPSLHKKNSNVSLSVSTNHFSLVYLVN